MTYNGSIDYHNAKCFTDWLTKKYGITYKAFVQKPDIIQKTYICEYTNDTGNNFVAVENYSETSGSIIEGFNVDSLFVQS